jgi:hypothetical protein
VAGRIRSIEKSNDHIGNGTRDLPACSIVPQPTTLQRDIWFFFFFPIWIYFRQCRVLNRSVAWPPPPPTPMTTATVLDVCVHRTVRKRDVICLKVWQLVVKPGHISALEKHESVALEAHPKQFKCSSYCLAGQYRGHSC